MLSEAAKEALATGQSYHTVSNILLDQVGDVAVQLDNSVNKLPLY